MYITYVVVLINLDPRPPRRPPPRESEKCCLTYFFLFNDFVLSRSVLDIEKVYHMGFFCNIAHPVSKVLAPHVVM